MTKDEALKLALEALESCDCGDYSTGHVIYPSFNVDAVNKAIDAIDDVLAQPWEKFCDSNCVWTDHHADCKLAEQEPVQTIPSFAQLQQIIMNLEHCLSRDSKQEFLRVWIRDWTEHKLSQTTTPPQRKPLTDEEVNKLVDDEDWYNDPHGFVRAIEAAHGIKGEA